MATSQVWKWELVLGLTLALGSDAAWAQGRGGRSGGIQVGASGGTQNHKAMQQARQHINQQLQQGQRVLSEASDKADEVRSEYQKANTEHKRNMKELAQAKKFAQEKAKNLPRFKAARERTDELRRELADARKKVVEQLMRDQEDYQAAMKEHEHALSEQKANSGPGVPQETRRVLAKKVSDAEKKLRNIEDVAMADNSEAKAIKEKMKAAAAEVAAQAKKRKDAIENDQRLSSAKVGFHRTRDALKVAKQNLDQAEGELNGIRSQMSALANQGAALHAQQQLLQRTQQGGRSGSGGGRYGGSTR
jgi:chromosome segregation ATPase